MNGATKNGIRNERAGVTEYPHEEEATYRVQTSLLNRQRRVTRRHARRTHSAPESWGDTVLYER